ncbi:hypothetical protein [Streptomyces sp. CC219B]|uniref:hypothetical protein n=1 Tax=Streptomyces sp. CC219B TaxID=3044574 RepID=UPI0024A94221|nr:hypothetical protein [Streptomyces sp. CC219B]
MHTLAIESGPVFVERLDDLDDRPWATVYQLSGRRIEGTVVIEPVFREPVRVFHRGDLPHETDFEALPSGLHVYYGKRDRYSRHDPEGTLHVNGVQLVGGVVLDKEMDISFSVRRPDPSGYYDEPAPSGTRAKTRQLVNALVWHHRGSGAAHEKAVVLARHERQKRHDSIAADARAVEKVIRELKGRLADLEMRRHLHTEDAFEQFLAEQR